MSRPDFNVIEEYTGNGLLADYTFGFKVESVDHLLIIKYDDTGEKVFEVIGEGDPTYIDSIEVDSVTGTGVVHLADVVEADYRLKIMLANDEPVQAFEFKNKLALTMQRIEQAFDYVMGAVQRLAYLSKRSIKIDYDDNIDNFDPIIPAGIVGVIEGIPMTNGAGSGWASPDTWMTKPDLEVMVAAAEAAQAAAEAAALDADGSAGDAQTAQAAAEVAQAAAEAAQAAAEVAAGTPQIIGSKGSPTSISSATAIAVPGSYRYNIIYCIGDSGAPQDMSALNPQIATGGVVDTKKLTLIGCDDTATVRLVDGNGVKLKGGGELYLYNNTIAEFFWDLTNWVQV